MLEICMIFQTKGKYKLMNLKALPIYSELISASCWAFTAILGCFLGGIISDMVGRRRVIVVSLIPFLMGSIMVRWPIRELYVTQLDQSDHWIFWSKVANSSSLALILLSRCLTGLGDGILYPNTIGITQIIEDYLFVCWSTNRRIGRPIVHLVP